MRRLFALVVVVGFCGLCAWLFVAASRPDPLPVGSMLPLVRARDVGGNVSKPLTVSAHGMTVVMVYHTTCPACRETFRMLNEDTARLDQLGVLLEPISSDPDSLVRKFRASWPALAHAPTVRWWVASAKVLHHAFPLPGTPGFYVFARDGRLLRKVLGERTPGALFAGLDGLGDPDSRAGTAAADHRASHPRRGTLNPKESLK